jgi:hypothetical protein
MESGVSRQASRKLIKGKKMECFSMESPGKIRDRGFEREPFQSVIRA